MTFRSETRGGPTRAVPVQSTPTVLSGGRFACHTSCFRGTTRTCHLFAKPQKRDTSRPTCYDTGLSSQPAATLKRNSSGWSGRLVLLRVAPAVKEARDAPPGFPGVFLDGLGSSVLSQPGTSASAQAESSFMLDAHAIVQTLTETGFAPAHADALVGGGRATNCSSLW